MVGIKATGIPCPRKTLVAAAVAAALPFVHLSAQAQETTLPEVKVTGGVAAQPGLTPPHAGGQVARGGGLGLLGTTDAMDVPFSTINYTSQFLEDQQLRSLADVVVNEASARVTTGSGGFGEDFQIRGFPVPSGDVGLNGLYGLVSASRVPVEVLERVEVLNGPGALMNGIAPGGSIGGGINIVTKRAADVPLTRLTMKYMSQSMLGLHADVGRRFGAGKEWGVRFNGVFRNGEGSIENSDQSLTVGGLGIDYRGQRLRWSLDLLSQYEDFDQLRPQIGFRPGITSLPSPPDARRNFYASNPLTLSDKTIASRIEYDFNDSVTAYAGAGYREGYADQVFPVTTAGTDTAGNFSVRGTYYDSYSETSSANAGLRFRFRTGAIGHTLALGVSELRQEAGNAYVPGATVVNSNIYNPVPLPAVAAARMDPRKASETSLSSFAVADTMSFGKDRVLLTLGARDQTVKVDNFNTATGVRTGSYEASSVAPLVGVVFKPMANVSLYGNHTAGLTRGEVVGATFANAGQVLPPYKSKQNEVGVKVDLGRITTIASLFQIQKPSIQTDVATNTRSADGEQRHRGLSLSAYGEVWQGLRVMASAVVYDAKLTHTAGGVNDGKDANGVPEYTYNLGVDWDTPWVKGLSLNGRINHNAPSYFDAANTLRFDSWTRVDVGVRYFTMVAGKEVALRANIENLFDKNFWLQSGTYATVGSPRTLLLSASVDF